MYIDIYTKMGEISEQLSLLNQRMERIEDKTTEIHSLVPFGRWFEKFSTGLARHIGRIKGGISNSILYNIYPENDYEIQYGEVDGVTYL